MRMTKMDLLRAFLVTSVLLSRESCAFLSSSSSPAISTWVKSDNDRNGQTEPGVNSSSGRDGLVQELQSEIASLYATMTAQKENYQTTMSSLQADADGRVQQAECDVRVIQEEYEQYKQEMKQKLQNAVSPAQMASLQDEVEQMEERTWQLQEKLDQALAQLRQNREDRKQLMGEMVALKESYIDKLNELEDQLESVQDERVRDQQESTKRLAQAEQDAKAQLKQAIDEGRKQVDELTIAYTKRIAAKDEEIAQTRFALSQAKQTIQQKDEKIDQLETDAKSIRKLLRKSVGLAKDRFVHRLRSVVPGRKRASNEQQNIDEGEPDSKPVVE